MMRSAEFDATVKNGVRAVQRDIVLHVRRDSEPDGPRFGLIVSKRVGSAVERHRVSRRLRHVAREVVGELNPGDRVVIRALPTSAGASSQAFRRQLSAGIGRVFGSTSGKR